MTEKLYLISSEKFTSCNNHSIAQSFSECLFQWVQTWAVRRPLTSVRLGLGNRSRVIWNVEDSLTMEIVKMGAMMGSSKSHDHKIISGNILISFM